MFDLAGMFVGATLLGATAPFNHPLATAAVVAGLFATSAVVLWPNFRRRRAIRQHDRELLRAFDELERLGLF